MSISPASTTQILLQDDFSNNAPLNPAIWGINQYQPVNNPSYYGRTQIQQSLPTVSNGALQLTLQTYNPTGPGNALLGSEIISNQTFNDSGGGIAFTAVARMVDPVPGTVGGIFGYNYNTATNLDNEIDFESLSNEATTQNDQEETNVYSNQPLGTGNPLSVPDPSLTSYQTYTMEWFPNAVQWFIDGTLVREDTVNVPQSPMALHLNFWAPNTTWAAAYSASLVPATTAQTNTAYSFDVASVSVAKIENNTIALTVTGTVMNQPINDRSTLTPFSSVVITDPVAGQTEAISVTLSAAANGTLTNLGGGTYNAATGVYTDSGSLASVTSALNGLVFSPTAGEVQIGQTVVTGFTISDTDTDGAIATDSTTSVIATAVFPPITIADTTSDTTTSGVEQAYSGPVAGLQYEFITTTHDNLAITATAPNSFIHTGSGNDAIDVSHVNGTNVLDGSSGSNFLVGGTGFDTFFLDDRAVLSDVFSSAVNFHSGDNATIWGITPSGFTLNTYNGQGAVGYTGLDFSFTAPGQPNANLVLTGFTSADLTNGKLTVTYGTTPTTGGVAGSTYMLIHAN